MSESKDTTMCIKKTMCSPALRWKQHNSFDQGKGLASVTHSELDRNLITVYCTFATFFMLIRVAPILQHQLHLAKLLVHSYTLMDLIL